MKAKRVGIIFVEERQMWRRGGIKALQLASPIGKWHRWWMWKRLEMLRARAIMPDIRKRISMALTQGWHCIRNHLPHQGSRVLAGHRKGAARIRKAIG